MEPKTVCKLRASISGALPSVTLTWNPPENCTETSDVVRYHIRYRKESHYNNHGRYIYLTSLPGSSRKLVLQCGGTSKTSLLQPLNTYKFQVRAEGQDETFGRWKTVKCYISKYRILCTY